MPQIQFNISFNDQSYGSNGIALSVSEFKQQFLWGIPLCNPTTGDTISDSTIKQKIIGAQTMVETILDLKLFKQYIQETKDFVREEYVSWMHIKTTWLVNKIFTIFGQLGHQKVLQFPNEWVTFHTENPSNPKNMSRIVNMVPNGNGSSVAVQFLANSNIAWYNFYGSRVIPDYWQIQYLTGFEKLPADIMNFIGKKAALEVLPIIEQIVSSAGGVFGAANSSLSLDGMSQNISRVNSGNIFKERIRQYTEEIKNEGTLLRNAYTGILFDVA